LFQESEDNPNYTTYQRETDEDLFWVEKSPRKINGYFFHVQELLQNPQRVFFDGASRKFDLRVYNVFLFIPQQKTIYHIFANRADRVDVKFSAEPFQQIYDLSEEDRHDYAKLQAFMRPNLTNIFQLQKHQKIKYNPTFQQAIDRQLLSEHTFPLISKKI
jgi:hypothetical protein